MRILILTTCWFLLLTCNNLLRNGSILIFYIFNYCDHGTNSHHIEYKGLKVKAGSEVTGVWGCLVLQPLPTHLGQPNLEGHSRVSGGPQLKEEARLRDGGGSCDPLLSPAEHTLPWAPGGWHRSQTPSPIHASMTSPRPVSQPY